MDDQQLKENCAIAKKVYESSSGQRKSKKGMNCKNISKYVSAKQIFNTNLRIKQQITRSYKFLRISKRIDDIKIFLKLNKMYSIRYTKSWYKLYWVLKHRNVMSYIGRKSKLSIIEFFKILIYSNFLWFNIFRHKHDNSILINGYFNNFPIWTKYPLAGYKITKLHKNLGNSTISFIKYIRSFFIKFSFFLWSPLLTYLFNQRRIKKFLRYQRLGLAQNKIYNLFFEQNFFKRALFFVRMQLLTRKITLFVFLRRRKLSNYLFKYSRFLKFRLIQLTNNQLINQYSDWIILKKNINYFKIKFPFKFKYWSTTETSRKSVNIWFPRIFSDLKTNKIKQKKLILQFSTLKKLNLKRYKQTLFRIQILTNLNLKLQYSIKKQINYIKNYFFNSKSSRSQQLHYSRYFWKYFFLKNYNISFLGKITKNLTFRGVV